MRELIVDFDKENPLEQGNEAGYIGENNATKLIVRPGTELLESGSESIVAVFMCSDGIYKTDHYQPAQELEIMLGAHLTRDHYLGLQLEGYSQTDDLLYKSPMVTKIHFMPSITEKQNVIEPLNYLYSTQIALNSQARHSHKNADCLDLLDGNETGLTYNNKKVCKYSDVKTAVITVEKDGLEGMAGIPNANTLSFIVYSTPEDFIISEKDEIISVEIKLSGEDYPDWINLDEMYVNNMENPYILNKGRVYYDELNAVMVLCSVYFLIQPNEIAKRVAAFNLDSMRITYIDNGDE